MTTNNHKKLEVKTKKKNIKRDRLTPKEIEDRTYNDFLIDYEGRTVAENKRLVKLQLQAMKMQRGLVRGI